MNFTIAANLMLNLLIEAQKIGVLLNQAHARGSLGLSDAEIAAVISDADRAKEAAEQAVAALKRED